jgi:serine/threonine-protein kinase
MEGSVRQAGPTLRVTVQLVEATSGANLWAETYDRPFQPETIFALQDELVPRIVCTVADAVLPHSMSEALRHGAADTLTPYEAMLRGYGYYERVSPAEHAEVRTLLERAVRQAPGHAGCWALLSCLYVDEYRFGFNGEPDPLGRALAAARRAVEAAPSDHLAHLGLAMALFYSRDLAAFRTAAERTVALNPMAGGPLVLMGILTGLSGDWARGRALWERGLPLNPYHQGWVWMGPFFDAYRQGDYKGALDAALRVNIPNDFFSQAALLAAYGQLGDRDAARHALRQLVTVKPDIGAVAREQLGRWVCEPAVLEHLLDGLRKAGLDVAAAHPPSDSSTPTRQAAGVAIAVLPFSDMSPAKDQDYLCEGMAEEIMNALVPIAGIRVASRTSAFRARQEGKDLAEISRALSVSHVLEGSVRAAGSRLRVTAQLTDVETGCQLWSERYDREAADVFALQDAIAAGVVEAVKARLAPGERAVRARPQVDSLEAYQKYLKGRYLRYTKNDHSAALSAFEEAVRLEPSHAPSWVGLAEVKVLVAVYGFTPARQGYAAAKKALETAARLQGETADAQYVAGMVAFGERDWPASERASRRAIELEPDNVRALCWLGVLHALLGRLEEAEARLEHARRIDPLAPYPYAMSGFILLASGRAPESVRFLEQALAFDPNYNLALWLYGVALVGVGRASEAIGVLEHATTPSHRGGFIDGVRGWALASAGRIDEARGVLASLRARPAPAPTLVAEGWLLAALGETDAAFALLDRAAAECQPMANFGGLPSFDPLRRDPRFAALLARLGLPASADSRHTRLDRP